MSKDSEAPSSTELPLATYSEYRQAEYLVELIERKHLAVDCWSSIVVTDHTFATEYKIVEDWMFLFNIRTQETNEAESKYKNIDFEVKHSFVRRTTKEWTNKFEPVNYDLSADWNVMLMSQTIVN